MLISSIYTERPYIPLLEIYKVFIYKLCSIGGKLLSIIIDKLQVKYRSTLIKKTTKKLYVRQFGWDGRLLKSNEGDYWRQFLI